MNYGFIGFGNLAKAVYQGLKSVNNIQFAYFARSKKEADILFFDHIEALVSFADVIWLGIKPQDSKGVLEQLQPLDLTGKLIVTPVAGKKIAFVEDYLGKNLPVVRIMPNLAMAYRKSVTAFATNQPQNPRTEEIFNVLTKLGKAVKLNEDGFDLFTSVFGSGPAFILAFIQIFKEKMREFDLPGNVLDELLLGLTEGATHYFAENQANYSIEELIRNITSKGGTTQAGLDYFRTHNIGKHFEGVLDAARNRSEEMSRS
ncbi:MAG: pyrroline-5-carboxylate reductase dimerization domain-containing protein [Bacteroidia bacterium]|nr:pyrroline-5-carboxylate reductase dimerization domain-containing protein [Bacteroidia bacterium]